MSKWNKTNFGDIHDNLKSLQQKLTIMQQANSSTNEDIIAEVVKVEQEISEWHAREEVFYRQKSREIMFHEVDQNTKHFHVQANKRRSRNKIESLLRPNLKLVYRQR